MLFIFRQLWSMFCSGVWLLLLVFLQQQGRSEPDQVQSHLRPRYPPCECHSPTACMHVHRCTHQTHTSRHLCTHMHVCVCTLSYSLYTQLFARHVRLLVLWPALQVGIITKEETGLVRLHVVSEVTPRAKSHIQVRQPPNRLLFGLQPNCLTKFLSTPNFHSHHFFF